MKSTDSTNLIETVIASGAAAAYLSTIPTNQSTAGNGTISLTLGSPPECAISVEAGGKRPLMKDVNGVYNLLSAGIQSLQSWGILSFSSSFATAIGGYPERAVVQYDGSFYVSTADDNLTVPGASGATWDSMFDGMASLSDWTTVSGQTGYRICPDGEIEMWGVATVPATGVTFAQINFTFPFTFPNQCYGVNGNSLGIADTEASGGGGWPSVSSDNATTKGARLTAECFGQYKFTNTVDIFWRARGR